MQQITLTVQTDDPMLAAMLRLVAANRLPIVVDAIERPAPDETERLLLSCELSVAALQPVTIDLAPGAPAIRVDHDDAEAMGVAGGASPPASTAIEVDYMPPDEDAAYRPHATRSEPADDKRHEIDLQLLIVSRLADRHALADVCRHLLKPLAGKGWSIDGDREAMFTRRAEEFATYAPRHLKAAAEHLLRGKHVNFPDADEILKAIGLAVRPGSEKAAA